MSEHKKNGKVGAVMVVGSGIAGIQAALDLANSGMKVYMVENGISIGGVMAQLDKTFPTNDCSACILSPKLVEVGRHPNVEILTRRTVESVEGEPGRFTVKLTKAPRFIDLSKCTGCGDCAAVCPITVKADFNENLSDRKATYRHFPQAIPSGFAIDKLGTAPCKAACPTHISVQGYVALIAAGKYKEALRLIKQENPFPSVCGRVCNHPCEEACMRGRVEQPIDIMHLKRFVADLDLNDATKYIPEIKEKKGKKVAVVGAGPDDGDLLALLFLDLGDVLGGIVEVEIGDKALEVHDVDGLLDPAAHAGLLAGMVADPAADAREGVLLLDEPEGFLVFAGCDEGHVALDADVGGAGRLAGGRTQLVDGEPAGDGLGEMPVGGLSVAQVLVEIGLDRDGTDGGTVAAARALGEIDEPGRLRELDGEAARLALDGLHRPAGQDLHVGMPADLDEFRGENAGRTVVGGERLVELGHDPANADPVFYHVDLHPGIGEVQGGLDPGDPGSHHHHGADFSILLMFRHVTTSVFESKLKRLFHRATQAKPQAP